MEFYTCKELPKAIIEFCSKVMENNNTVDEKSAGVREDVEFLVTSCMLSRSIEIRTEAYAAISRIVDDAINVQIATEINSKRYRRLNFLLLSKIFYQLAAFGLFDKCFQVLKLF